MRLLLGGLSLARAIRLQLGDLPLLLADHLPIRPDGGDGDDFGGVGDGAACPQWARHRTGRSTAHGTSCAGPQHPVALAGRLETLEPVTCPHQLPETLALLQLEPMPEGW